MSFDHIKFEGQEVVCTHCGQRRMIREVGKMIIDFIPEHTDCKPGPRLAELSPVLAIVMRAAEVKRHGGARW